MSTFMFFGNSTMMALRSTALRVLKSSWTILMKYGWYSGAKRHDRFAQRLLPLRNLFRVVGFLEARDLGLGLVVELQIARNSLLKLQCRRTLRVDAGLCVGGRCCRRRLIGRTRRLLANAGCSSRFGAFGRSAADQQ